MRADARQAAPTLAGAGRGGPLRSPYCAAVAGEHARALSTLSGPQPDLLVVAARREDGGLAVERHARDQVGVGEYMLQHGLGRAARVAHRPKPRGAVAAATCEEAAPESERAHRVLVPRQHDRPKRALRPHGH